MCSEMKLRRIMEKLERLGDDVGDVFHFETETT